MQERKVMQKDMRQVMRRVHDFLKDARKKQQMKLPSEAYFLNEDEIVCFQRKRGDSRYPYTFDGLTLWAYSSGNVKIQESAFNILLGWEISLEPNLAFFFGIKQGERYLPVSITGAARQPYEGDILRYIVYTPAAAYYIAESENLDGCLKLYVNEKKNVRMICTIHNKGSQACETYLASYIVPFMRHASAEGFEDKWYKSCSLTDDGFLFATTECVNRTLCLQHYGSIVRKCERKVTSTTSPSDYKGGSMQQLYAAESLIKGSFSEGKAYCGFTESAIAGDLCNVTLLPAESVTLDYTFAVSDDKTEAVYRAHCSEDFVGRELFRDLPRVQIETDVVQDKRFSYFLHNVFRQVEFCSRAKNYAGDLIGFRDIFQQLECALFWIPEVCRNRMVEALGYIGENGRVPRQYSYQQNRAVLPRMDLREFIDQGVWIISAVYTYLAVTNDYSILYEECGYYSIEGQSVSFSDKKNTVLEHLLRITDFLLNNMDDQTHCIHALYGDWNDALDGLGNTDDPGKEFGTGVSVMATMQVYQSCLQMCEILDHEDKFQKKEGEYRETAALILRGLFDYAIDDDGKGHQKIIHGWGDKRLFKVGSFCDNDGQSRDSATSNAFWVLSGINGKKDMREHILQAYSRLDSKNGIRTFYPYFAPDNKLVGRITQLPEGTAENAAVYIHATLFAIWSLYELGEVEFAEKQLLKILPITHSYISTTPFVMPNSYCYNEQYGYDGESMNDWFTGSGCVLGKIVFLEIFGFKPDLNGFVLRPVQNSVFRSFQVTLRVKEGILRLNYRNEQRGTRKFVLHDEGKLGDPIVCEETEIYVRNQELYQRNLCIEIID